MTAYKAGVTVAICTHNGKLRLQPTISHILSQQVPPEIEWEVLIVNNASTDRTVEFVYESWPCELFHRLRIVDEKKLGAIYARQRAMKEARYSYLSYIDDDNWISPNWIQEVFVTFEKNPTVGIVNCPSVGCFETEPPVYLEGLKGWLALGSQEESEGIVSGKPIKYWTAGLSIRLQVFDAIKNSDISFCLTGRKGKGVSGGEDHELCLIVALLGWDAYFNTKIYFTHYIPTSRMQVKYLRNLILCGSRSRNILDIYKHNFLEETSLSPYLFVINLLSLWLISTFKYALKFCIGMIDRPLHPNLIAYLQSTGYIQGYFINFKSIRTAMRNAQVIGKIKSKH